MILDTMLTIIPSIKVMNMPLSICNVIEKLNIFEIKSINSNNIGIKIVNRISILL